MATLSTPGIASGIDVQRIVTQLVALERAPLQQLQSTASSLKTKLSLYGSIKSQMSTLQDAATKLGSSTGWNAVTAKSSNETAVRVTASSGAPATSLTMEVQQLAKAQSTASSAVVTGSAMGSGSMSIELGSWASGSFVAGSGTPLSVTINPGEDTLSEIAAKINDADSGVSATVLRDSSGERLLVRSKATGEENGFRIQVTDADGNNSDGAGLSRLAYDTGTTGAMALSQGGQNALATINNVSISSASNTLSDTLPGMSIQLSQVTTAPVEIDVSTDMEAIKKNIQGFVDAYNQINQTLVDATRYDASTQSAGILQGDATAIGLQNALRGMMRSVTTSTPFSRLSDVGIEFQTGGSLKVNSEKFESALGNLDGLKSLFRVETGDTSTEGFGLKLKKFAQGLINSDGLLTNKSSALQKSISRNSSEQEKVNDRASRAEVRYLAQYNAMDAAVGQLNGLSAFVTQQITLWNKSS